MTEREWRSIALLLQCGFKWSEPFGPGHDRTYRTFLAGYEAKDIAAALRKLVAGGQVFGPTPGELVHALEGNDDRLTFIEAYSAIYDSRPACGGRGVLWTHKPGMSDNEAQLDRAYEIAPLLGAFVHSYGLNALRLLEVEHEDYGHIRKRELQDAWEQFAEANAHRDAAALAAGRRRELGRGRPRRLDPLAALPVGAPS